MVCSYKNYQNEAWAPARGGQPPTMKKSGWAMLTLEIPTVVWKHSGNSLSTTVLCWIICVAGGVNMWHGECVVDTVTFDRVTGKFTGNINTLCAEFKKECLPTLAWNRAGTPTKCDVMVIAVWSTTGTILVRDFAVFTVWYDVSVTALFAHCKIVYSEQDNVAIKFRKKSNISMRSVPWKNFMQNIDYLVEENLRKAYRSVETCISATVDELKIM